MSTHPSEWRLARLYARELPEPEAREARAHAEACTRCQRVLRGLAQEQARFEGAIAFERFAAGVERAAARPAPRAPSRAREWGLAAAAVVLLALAVSPLVPRGSGPAPEPLNRSKGGAAAELRIAAGGGEGSQRVARPEVEEPLAEGERVRLGYTAGEQRYVLAVSVDEAGGLSELYAEGGRSLAVEPGAGQHWLAGALEFTGSGRERVVVVLSGEPLEVEAVRVAARRAWEAAGRRLEAMPRLGVGGEETHWVLRKP